MAAGRVAAWWRWWLACAALCLSLGQDGATPADYLPGRKVDGNDGAYFRYVHAIHAPTPQELKQAERMSEDVRCQGCEVMLLNMLNGTGTLTEDSILDIFDGQPEGFVPPPGPSQEEFVKYHRRGCNKHFRDHLLSQGWRIRRCASADADAEVDVELGLPGASSRKLWCLQKAEPPSDLDSSTFSSYNEGIFNVCASTVGRNSMEMAAYIGEQLGDGRPLQEVVRDACRSAGRCDAWKAQRRKLAERARNRHGRHGGMGANSAEL